MSYWPTILRLFPYISCTRSVKFSGRSIIVKYTFHALHGTLIDRFWPCSWSFRPRDYSDKIYFGRFWYSHNANITLKICTQVVYVHVFFFENFSLLSQTNLRYEGGGWLPPPPEQINFQHDNKKTRPCLNCNILLLNKRNFKC